MPRHARFNNPDYKFSERLSWPFWRKDVIVQLQAFGYDSREAEKIFDRYETEMRQRFKNGDRTYDTAYNFAHTWHSETMREAPRVVADFNTLDDLIAHARSEGATHVSGDGAHTKLYFPRGGQYPYEEAEVWRKAGYWHAQGPHARAGVTRLPADARPLGSQRRERRAAESAERLPGTRNVARRITNAEERFITFARETAGLNRDEAIRALAAYRKERAIKIDPITGQFTFTHGGFAEPDVLRRAASGDYDAPPHRSRRRPMRAREAGPVDDPFYIIQGLYDDGYSAGDEFGYDDEGEAINQARKLADSHYFEGDYVRVITRDGELVWDSREG